MWKLEIGDKVCVRTRFVPDGFIARIKDDSVLIVPNPTKDQYLTFHEFWHKLADIRPNKDIPTRTFPVWTI